MEQLSINFPTTSPINIEKLSGQNKRLFDYLKSGHTIHCMSEARKRLKIGYLNSRASDLINKFGIPIKKKRIKVRDTDGELTTVVEYSL